MKALFIPTCDLCVVCMFGTVGSPSSLSERLVVMRATPPLNFSGGLVAAGIDLLVCDTGLVAVG
jgi:hypothetical protein